MFALPASFRPSQRSMFKETTENNHFAGGPYTDLDPYRSIAPIDHKDG